MKKRESATYELHPWHKEVSQDSQDLQNISMEEIRWAKAANRLVDKVENNGSLMFNTKRRLVMTTQLMKNCVTFHQQQYCL